MDLDGLGRPCKVCGRKINGLGYTCSKCGEHYCFLCIYNADWKCPECRNELM
jgi:hypothetical protein